MLKALRNWYILANHKYYICQPMTFEIGFYVHDSKFNLSRLQNCYVCFHEMMFSRNDYGFILVM